MGLSFAILPTVQGSQDQIKHQHDRPNHQRPHHPEKIQIPVPLQIYG